ncbi:MAG: hypothetical protein GVY10_10040 [Verrucomicrobia bacterium]|jgi:hypothetical protein|nr:hypothetical protein [Verrucomicrobiota bacterium]
MSKSGTILLGLLPLAASGQYLELFTEAEANAGLGGDAFATPFFDTAATSGSTVYSFVRGLPSVGAGITAYDAGTGQFSVVATPGQIGAATGGGSIGVKYGFTVVDGGSTLRYLDFFGNAIYDTEIATGTTTQVSSTTDPITSNTIFRGDGSGFAYDSGNDRILSISSAGAFTELLNSTDLAALTGDDRISGSLGLSGDTLYIGSSQTDDLFFWDLSLGSGGTVFSSVSIDALSDDTDGSIGFGDIFAAPDGLVYFYESDSDAVFSFDPGNPDGSLAVVLDEAALNGGPGSDRVSEFFWLDGELGWADDADGAYVVPEPGLAALALGAAGFVLVIRRRRRRA